MLCFWKRILYIKRRGRISSSYFFIIVLPRFMILVILFRVLHFKKRFLFLYTSVVITVRQYFCGDNIDPPFIQSSQCCRSSRHETWFSCVASLFLKVFISRTEIKWWSGYANNLPGSVRYWVLVFYSFLLGFHFLFRNCFCYKPAVKKTTFVYPSFLRRLFFLRHKCEYYNI